MPSSNAGHPDQRWGGATFAQHGDDMMILNLFSLLGIDRPSYLDLGAHHPTNISNTKLLYDRGSRGVNVDANPELIAEFQRERPEDINVCCGVGPTAGVAKLHMFSPTSGLNTLSPDAVELLRGAMTVRGTIDVEVKTVTQIIDEHCRGFWPQFLSCDIEGYDYDVLSSAFFHVSAPVVICVETRRHDTERMSHMLSGKGYFLYCRMGENLFFVRIDLRDKVY